MSRTSCRHGCEDARDAPEERREKGWELSSFHGDTLPWCHKVTARAQARGEDLITQDRVEITPHACVCGGLRAACVLRDLEGAEGHLCCQ